MRFSTHSKAHQQLMILIWLKWITIHSQLLRATTWNCAGIHVPPPEVFLSWDEREQENTPVLFGFWPWIYLSALCTAFCTHHCCQYLLVSCQIYAPLCLQLSISLQHIAMWITTCLHQPAHRKWYVHPLCSSHSINPKPRKVELHCEGKLAQLYTLPLQM